MLDKHIQEQILSFVREKPRTIQEIALLIQKNWRTADRYIETIQTETGLIAVRIFREGSRGALKLVHWNALENARGSTYQEGLLQKIIRGRKKEDFSPLEIYQFADKQKREAFLSTTEFATQGKIKFDTLLQKAERQLLFFSGNLSWMNLGPKMRETLHELTKRNVSIKVLTRIDITSLKQTQEMLHFNQRVGKDVIEIRHCEQPLRAVVIDDTCATIKEVLSPEMIRELKEKTFIFYLLQDPVWISWMQKVFWHLWGISVEAKERIDALISIQQIQEKEQTQKRR